MCTDTLWLSMDLCKEEEVMKLKVSLRFCNFYNLMNTMHTPVFGHILYGNKYAEYWGKYSIFNESVAHICIFSNGYLDFWRTPGEGFTVGQYSVPCRMFWQFICHTLVILDILQCPWYMSWIWGDGSASVTWWLVF